MMDGCTEGQDRKAWEALEERTMGIEHEGVE